MYTFPDTSVSVCTVKPLSRHRRTWSRWDGCRWEECCVGCRVADTGVSRLRYCSFRTKFPARRAGSRSWVGSIKCCCERWTSKLWRFEFVDGRNIFENVSVPVSFGSVAIKFSQNGLLSKRLQKDLWRQKGNHIRKLFLELWWRRKVSTFYRSF